MSSTDPAGVAGPPPASRSALDRRARERTLRRGRAVATAASVGGFASLVAVLLGAPSAAVAPGATSATTGGVAATSTQSTASSTATRSVVPDTTTHAS